MQSPRKIAKIKSPTFQHLTENNQSVRAHSNGCSSYGDIPPQSPIISGIPSRDSVAHIQNMPREITHKIFSYLLTNPILGTGTAITTIADPVKNGKRVVNVPKYELHPAILRVCKQMYHDGVHVLYQHNEFIMDCTNWMYRDDSNEELGGIYEYTSSYDQDYFPITTALNVSPLTRYAEHSNVAPTEQDWEYQGNEFFYEQPTFNRLVGPQARYVRKWKVIVRGDEGHYTHRFDEAALAQFCHAISQCPDLSLSFIVCIDKTSEQTRKATRADFARHLSFEEIFAPLKLLRNVQSVEFKEAHSNIDEEKGGEEFPESLPVYLDEIHQMVEDSAATLTSGKEKDKYIDLMKGSSPLADPINLMCDELVAYTQTFESVPEFRQDIDVGNLDTTNQHKKSYNTLEGTLRQARAAALVGNLKLFKSLRMQLLLDIENDQFQRIKRCFSKLNEFNVQDRVFRGMLCQGEFHDRIYEDQGFILDLNKSSPETRHWREKITNALSLLEEYAESLEIDLNKNSIYRPGYRLLSPGAYVKDPAREKLLRRVRKAHKFRDYGFFIHCFQKVVNQLNDQYIEILKAKQNLFRWDSRPAPRGIDIPVGNVKIIFDHDIEPVEWTIRDFDYSHKPGKRARETTKEAPSPAKRQRHSR
ncbi:hypothetical protein BELL_0388g00070 [Botrytis elliptica]|uniref:Uncharacterized protein n=1 Tax=Botrytis elliptica TaxID=278938 RepID=A0A4Z1JVC9_9HELO|nr:hypothetical protein EAE99_004338 [Botrytis elliptica]TGO73123.1 hypothetical protein BELL_0388g00070 [Botrytis elliptica]